MFSTKLNRVAQRATSVAAISNATSTAAHRPSQCIGTRRPHQRRHSSSKASCPPDSSTGGKPAPAAKASASSDENAAGTKSSISGSTFQPRAKRVARTKKTRSPSADKPENQFVGLPAVQTTHGWRYDEFSMSSFFSLNRPLSIANKIPRQATADEFANIFEAKLRNDPWSDGNSAERRPEDVIYTLHPSLSGLAAASFGGQEESSPWDVPQEGATSQDGVKHLDGPPPMKSLDDVLAQFQHMPYKPPPPPQPFPEDQRSNKKRLVKTQESLEQQLRDHFSNMHKTRQRKYQTTITMTESTTEDGHTLLVAERTPFVQIPSKPQIHRQESREIPRMRRARHPAGMTCLPNRGKQPHRVFLVTETMRWERRAPTQRVKMVLISVKRQRKLKMKKHKYKKLMKRTRNLRRKQDRA